jgi:hypothetical protein
MTLNQKLGYGFSALVAACALGAVGWVVLSGQAQDLDGLFAILVGLLFVLLFAIPPLQAAMKAGLFRKLTDRRKTEPGEAEKAKLSQTAQQKT